MLTFSALVAGSFSLGSRVANDLSPAALSAVRFVIACVVIGAAVGWLSGRSRGAGGGLRDGQGGGLGDGQGDGLGRGLFKRTAFAAPWRYLVLGGLLAIYFVLMFEGLKTAPPVSAAAVFTLTPLLSAGFGWLVLRQVITLRIGLALAIGAAGAVWVIFRADFSALVRFEIGTGEIIYFWGCVAHAAYTPLVRKLNRGEPAVVFTLGTLLAGTVLLLMWAAPEMLAMDWGALPVLVWVAVVYLAVFASAATFVLLQFSAMHLPSSKVMAYTYLVPIWVLAVEICLGAAFPSGWVMVGVAMTVLALLLLLEKVET
jgi:drug/metabolite transporter (DMT)-like permease